MEMAKLQIPLPLKLNSYNNIKRFLDAVKPLFPEQTAQTFGCHSSNYSFRLQDVGILPKEYKGTQEFLKAIFRQEHVNLVGITILNYNPAISLAYFANRPESVMMVGGDIATLETVETKIKSAFNHLNTTSREFEEHVDSSLEDAYGKFSFPSMIFNDNFANIINERIAEIDRCVKAQSFLATMILLGSTLEGILTAVAQHYPKRFNTASAAPKTKEGNVKPFGAWKLNELILVASHANVVKADVEKFCQTLRDFRNYIHPNEQFKNNFTPTMGTVKISLQVFKEALQQIDDFVGRYKE